MILTTGRGSAIYGEEKRWPRNLIPYDISAITSKFKETTIRFRHTPIIDTTHRTIIKNAMQTLMYAVGTESPGSTTRTACVYFRQRNDNDANFLTIQYGKGCSATVSGHSYF